MQFYDEISGAKISNEWKGARIVLIPERKGLKGKPVIRLNNQTGVKSERGLIDISVVTVSVCKEDITYIMIKEANSIDWRK